MIDHRAAHISEIPEDEGRMLRVGGHFVAIFHLRGGEVRSVQPWCPHRRGPLADGLLGDRSLVCPLHGRTFDLDTGKALRDEVGVTTYPARLDPDGTIVLSLPDSGPLPCTSDEGAATPEPERGDAASPFAARRAE